MNVGITFPVTLTDREAALIVRALRAEAHQVYLAAKLIQDLDGGSAGDAADGALDLHSEASQLASRIDDLKIAAGGAAS